MGAWRFMREQIQPLLAASGRALGYAGRAESASPATGSHKRHLIEQTAVIDAAFTPPALAGRGPTRLMPKREAR